MRERSTRFRFLTGAARERRQLISALDRHALMRILFVTMQYGSPYGQGTERYLGTLTVCLRQRGHDVAFLAGDPLGVRGPRRLGEVVDDEERIHAFPSSGWTAVRGLPAQVVGEWLGQYGPDLVHIANPAHVGCGVMEATRALGLPLVVTTMDFWWVCPKATLLRADRSVCDGTPAWSECVRCAALDHPSGIGKALGRVPKPLAGVTLAAFGVKAAMRGGSVHDVMRWMRRRELLTGCLDTADAVIYPSAATRDTIQPRLNHQRTRLIPYGLSSQWFESVRSVAAVPKPPDELTVGFAGAILPHKAPHLLLTAIRQLGWRETRIRLAGACDDPAYERSLRDAAQGLRVEFLGKVSAEAMPRFLRSLDVLALTSLWPENLPFVMLEAQAAGVPVVGGKLPGIADQVGDPGLLFEPGSATDLARALEYARLHPSLPAQVRVWTADEMTDATEAVYDEAMGRHPTH